MKKNEELWKDTLAALKKKLGRDYNTWIENRLTLKSYDKNSKTLYLGVADEFQKGQLEFKYLSEMEKAAVEAFGAPLSIRLLLPGNAVPEAEEPAKSREERFDDKDIIFNPRYTFDNFIVGDNCRFAAGAAQAVAQAPGKAYSPLFIYGDSGLGKTHLMNAIGIHILEHLPKLKVLYVTSETFTDEFVNATFQRKMNVFKEKYRKVDVLLIDDIQFISEKEKTIEEVFNTYNALYDSGKQMVFTSDRPPNELLSLDDRLKSRLAAGLTVNLQPPSLEVKIAILKNKAQLDGIAMDDDVGFSEVVLFIAEKIKSNVRELESAFNRVVAFSKFMDKPFSKALAKEVLSDLLDKGENGPSPKDVRKVVAAYFNISVSAIDSDERSRSFSVPRQIAMYIVREMTGLSYPNIGKLFKKDYATVHYACNKIKDEIVTDENLRNTVNILIEKLRTEY